jgi:hypothetical protein
LHQVHLNRRMPLDLKARLPCVPRARSKKKPVTCNQVTGKRNNPGSDLLSHAVGPRSTIGGRGLNFRVRNGNGCDPSPMTTGKGLRLAVRVRRRSHAYLPGVRQPIAPDIGAGVVDRPRLCCKERPAPSCRLPAGRWKLTAGGCQLSILQTIVSSFHSTRSCCVHFSVGKRELWSSLTAD